MKGQINTYIEHHLSDWTLTSCCLQLCIWPDKGDDAPKPNDAARQIFVDGYHNEQDKLDAQTWEMEIVDVPKRPALIVEKL